MSVLRHTGMLLVGVFALLAFFGQASSCFAEGAGVLPCHEQSGDSSSAVADPLADTHCCHGESNASLAGQAIAMAPLSLREQGYHARAFGASEGPVEEIDYPPQLS